MVLPVSAPTELPAAPPPRLLDQVRQLALQRGYHPKTADAFVAWVRRYILFQDRRHPGALGLAEIVHFLEQVAQTEARPLLALAAARAALDFLYSDVLHTDLGEWPPVHPPRLLDQVRQV